jgi:hypothetical protein
LFRSLHAQYLPNYAVRRLAAEPPGYTPPPPEAFAAAVETARDAARGVEAAGAVREELGSGSNNVSAAAGSAAAVGALAALRRRCNLRGGLAVGAGDLAQALAALAAFDVVLITEWMDASGSGGATAAAVAGRAGAMVGLLRHALGAKAPATLGHARAGVAPALPTSWRAAETLSDLPRAERPPSIEAWGLEGRGDAWRQQQAPASVLARLADENYFDLELYRAATALVWSRAGISTSVQS